MGPIFSLSFDPFTTFSFLPASTAAFPRSDPAHSTTLMVGVVDGKEDVVWLGGLVEEWIWKWFRRTQCMGVKMDR